MRQYTWDEYYEKFYDWAESTQVRNLSGLTSLGSADEVGEIIIELQTNVPAANRLLRKAVEAKLVFSGSDLVEFACINDKELATAAVRNSAERLTAEDMEYLYGEIDDAVVVEICRQRVLYCRKIFVKKRNRSNRKKTSLWRKSTYLQAITAHLRNAPVSLPLCLGRWPVSI